MYYFVQQNSTYFVHEFINAKHIAKLQNQEISYKILYKQLLKFGGTIRILSLQNTNRSFITRKCFNYLNNKSEDDKLRKVNQVMNQYTNRIFLQQHSLYSNLFSSQSYTFSIPQTEQMNLWFGKQTLQVNQLYEYSYFHKRDKKLLLFYIILKFLKNENDGGKSKMIVIENIEKINKNQLRTFLLSKQFGGSEKLVKDLQKRIVFLYSKNVTSYKFHLSFLAIMQENDQFLKSVIISDINTFESSDKLTHQRYYKRLPKDILIFSFRRDVYDYKVIQKSPINQFYSQEHGQDKYQLNDKVTAVLRKKYQVFPNAVISFLIPIEFLGLSTKNIEETYKTCLIRILPDNSGYLQFTFKGMPFLVDNFRKITL